MKKLDNISYHLGGIILYGALALFLAFIFRIIYVTKMKACYAQGYHQSILSEVDANIINEIKRYSKHREKLFFQLVKQKEASYKNFELNPTNFENEQRLFSNSLLLWSKSQDKGLQSSEPKQTKKLDLFYLQELDKLKPKFVISSYEPLANNYYKSFLEYFLVENKKSTVSRDLNSRMINENSYHSMFSDYDHNFSVMFFANLFKKHIFTDVNKIVQVVDNNSVSTKLFSSNELICEAHINYPNKNNLLINFTPNGRAEGSTKSPQIRYNLIVNNISQNNQSISLEGFSKNFIASFKDMEFDDEKPKAN